MGSDLNTKWYLIQKSHILQHDGTARSQLQWDCSCLLLKAVLGTGSSDFIFLSFQGCLALGWPKLLIRQWAPPIHSQKGTSSFAGNSRNLMPKSTVMNHPLSVATSCLPCQGSLGTCCEGVVPQAFELYRKNLLISQPCFFFFTESLSLPEFSYE